MAFAIYSFFRSLVRSLGSREAAASAQAAQPAPAAVRATPLRVVHKGPGRLVISGRMADVCAELDRLAALEAMGAQRLAPSR